MLIYKNEGPHQRYGGTFDFKGIYTKSELDKYLGRGWFRTMEGIVTGKDPEGSEKFDTVVDDLAPKEAEKPKDPKEVEKPKEAKSAVKERIIKKGNS